MLSNLFTDENGRKTNMVDGNCVIRIDDKTPIVGKIGKIVRGDANSNVITFEMPRYHDGEDLKDKSIRIIVQSTLGVYTENVYDIRYSNNLLRFNWLLSSADTTNGDITVAIEVYGISSSNQEYSLHSLPFELKIEDGLRATDSVIEIPDDWFTVIDGQIGNLLAVSHKHENIETLDKLDESEDGLLLFNGSEIVGGSNIQREVLPEQTEEHVGEIYQYIGETTSDYTHGLFYECVPVYNEYDYLIAYEWKPLETTFNADLSEYCLKEELENHSMSVNHITQGERTLWNSKADAESVPKKVSDLEDDVHLTDIHKHLNKDVLDKFSESDNGTLLYNGGNIASSSVPISSRMGNIISNTDDGLYANVDLSDYAKTADLDDVITNTHEHSNKDQVLDKLGVSGSKLTFNGEYVGDNEISANLGNSLTLGSDNKLYYKGHEHNNLYSLNKIGENSDGNLTYNGVNISPEIKISTKENNALIQENDGSYYVGSATTAISSIEGNVIEQKTDGIYVPKTQVTISSAEGNILNNNPDGLYVSSSGVNISSSNDNIITSADDGLFAEHNILSVNGISPDIDKKVTLDLDNIPNGTTRKLYDFETRDISSSYNGDSEKVVSSRYLKSQFSNKLEILDNLGENENGKLTFNNEDVASANVNVSSNSSNIIEMRSDGLFANVDLSSYAKTSEVANTYIKKDEIDDKYMSIANYTDSSTYEILGTKIKPQTLDYMNLENVGELDGASIEQKLLDHLQNTLMHNVGNLSSILINNSEWANGTLTNLTINDEGVLELEKTATDPDIYTLEMGTFISKIYDIGEVLPFQIITFDAVFNPYLSNIFFYVRTGTTASYSSSTWTEWKDVTETRNISNISTRYIQLKVEINTANMYKNVKINYIQMFYGTDIETEVSTARTDLDGVVHSSLKEHLDNIETNLKTMNTELGNLQLITEEETNSMMNELSLLFSE